MKNRLLLFIKRKIKLHSNKVLDVIIDDIESMLSISKTHGKNILLLAQIESELRHIEDVDSYKNCNSAQDRINFIINNIDSKELLMKLLATQKDNKDNISMLLNSLLAKYKVSELLLPQFDDYNLADSMIPFILDNKEKTEEMLSGFDQYSDSLKYTILTYFPDSIKEEGISHIHSRGFKILVINSFEDDLLKIRYIENEQNDYNKYSIIHSLKDKNLKEKYLDSLSDSYKIKLLDDFDSSFALEYIKNSSMDEKTKYSYYKNNGYQDLLLDLVITGSDDIKKLYIEEMKEEKITLSIFPLIKSNNIKCDLVNRLNLSFETILKLLDYIDDDENINLKDNVVLTDQNLLFLYDKIKSINAKKNILPLIKEEPYEGFIYDKLKELILELNGNNDEKTKLQINTLKEFYQLNKEFYINTNLKLFQENYFHKLISNKSFFFLLTKYLNYADLMTNVIDSNEEIYSNIDKIINLLYGKSKRIDDRLFKVVEGLYYNNDIANIEDILLPSIIYNIIKNPKFKLTKENSNQYEQQYNEVLDSLINNETNLDILKELYYERYFKLTKVEVERIIKQFDKDLDRLQINFDEEKYIDAIKVLKRLYVSNSKLELSEIVKDSEGISIIDSLSFEESVKDIYIRNFKDGLLKLNTLSSTRITLHNRDFEALEVPSYFNLLIHSTDAINRLEVQDHDYYKAWNENKNETNHTICCCHISNRILRCASSKGVVFGFTTFENKDLLGMSFDDLATNSNEYDLNVTKMMNHYCLNDTLDENTMLYNEVILERNQIDNEKISKLQPDCVVVFSTTEKEDFEESLLAAEQFNIPIVYIDKKKLLQEAISQELPNMDNNMDEETGRRLASSYLDLLCRYDLPYSSETIPDSCKELKKVLPKPKK